MNHDAQAKGGQQHQDERPLERPLEKLDGNRLVVLEGKGDGQKDDNEGCDEWKGHWSTPMAESMCSLEYIPNVPLTYTPCRKPLDSRMNGTVLHGPPAGKFR